MKKLTFLFVIISFFGSFFTASAQVSTGDSTTSPIAYVEENHEADYVVLRNMLSAVESAINEKRIDDLAPYLDENINVVFQNGEVADGLDAVKAFYAKIFNGDKAVLKDLQTKAGISKHAEIYGNTAVAYGTTTDEYTFIGGMKMSMYSVWTTTLIKKNNDWKVVSLQFTANVFDNPLLASAQKSAKYFGLGGIALGLILGYLTSLVCRKKKVVSANI